MQLGSTDEGSLPEGLGRSSPAFRSSRDGREAAGPAGTRFGGVSGSQDPVEQDRHLQGQGRQAKKLLAAAGARWLPESGRARSRSTGPGGAEAWVAVRRDSDAWCSRA